MYNLFNPMKWATGPFFEAYRLNESSLDWRSCKQTWNVAIPQELNIFELIVSPLATACFFLTACLQLQLTTFCRPSLFLVLRLTDILNPRCLLYSIIGPDSQLPDSCLHASVSTNTRPVDVNNTSFQRHDSGENSGLPAPSGGKGA